MSIKETINTTHITNKPKIISLQATLPQLKELKDFLQIQSVNSLAVNLSIVKDVAGFTLKGNILADITQECAVSLQPIHNKLNIPVIKKYYLQVKTKNKQLVINLNDEDSEKLTNNIINLYDIITEELVLNIDPYAKIIHLAEKKDDI